MKVWEDLVYLLMFCQLCKVILISVSSEVQPTDYSRNTRKLNLPFRCNVKGSFVIYFKRWVNRREKEERRGRSAKDLIFSARRLRNLLSASDWHRRKLAMQ